MPLIFGAPMGVSFDESLRKFVSLDALFALLPLDQSLRKFAPFFGTAIVLFGQSFRKFAALVALFPLRQSLEKFTP